MDTVIEFKKLLELDFDKIRSSLIEASTLQSVNQQSEKLNRLLLSCESSGANLDDTIDCEGDKRTSKSNSEVLTISPGVDGNRVKTFEDLIDIKLQEREKQPHLQPNSSLKSKSAEKRPFLKRGEGLRRFSTGGVFASPKSVKTTTPVRSKATVKLGCSEKPKKNLESNFENLANKEHPLLRKENATERCTKKRTDFSRKVMPINTRKQASKEYKLENVCSIPQTAKHRQEIKNTAISSGFSTIEIIKQIGDLEKRLLDLMTLKGQLTEERTSYDSRAGDNANEHLASSIELIRREISTLNSKVSSLTTKSESSDSKGCERVEDEEADDKNSRHLNDNVPLQASSESAPSISTLSNGDKITFASDQSITYVHQNGTLQTLYRDGLKEIRFPNGQIEKVHLDGSKTILYPDGQQRVIKAEGGGEEVILTDGTVYSASADCERTVYPNGDVEWRTEEYTRRHFSNGNIKTQYANGCSETIFSNGRVRLKDSRGNVLFDRRP